jgi:RNA polymerase sigma factor for flagellar operon FliA
VRLPDKERTVIEWHYVEGKKFECLAEKLGLSKGRISQLHAQALLRMRHWLDDGPCLDRKL